MIECRLIILPNIFASFLLLIWIFFFLSLSVSLSPSLQHQHWAIEAPFYMPALDIKSVRVSGMQCSLKFFSQK